MNPDACASWDLLADGKTVGNIALIPYKSENADDAALFSDNMQREYKYNENTLREARIEVSLTVKAEGAMNIIKNTFTFVDGPYNVIDMQSEASAYLEKGGKADLWTDIEHQFQKRRTVLCQRYMC